jgi:hypothetical protein
MMSNQFERPVTFLHGDGTTSPGRTGCYKRCAFVLDAKKLKPGSATALDAALLATRSQARATCTPCRPPKVDCRL